MSAPAIPIYDDTPARALRRAVEGGTEAFTYEEPGWMVEAMIDAAGQNLSPLRPTLGAGSFSRIAAALEERRAALEAQRDVACGGCCRTRRDPGVDPRRRRAEAEWAVESRHGAGSALAASTTFDGIGASIGRLQRFRPQAAGP